MNRDATVVQVAILLIIVAIVGVAVLRGNGQEGSQEIDTKSQSIQAIQEADAENMGAAIPTGDAAVEIAGVNDAVAPVRSYIEQPNSANTKLVKQYFAGVAEKSYDKACAVMSNAKCNVARPGSVIGFSKEFEKLTNGYEYVNIKDYGVVAPSGKQVVCVKYSYRYKNDPNPGLVSEILSFYLDDVGGETKITNRVCEKKYKEGRGLRDCPIQAAAEFCEGHIR